MSYVLGFLIVLGPLVVVHELGHFLFAKLFRVKAEAFAVGFGPKLLGWRWGETEFKICAIPLGGYVKLLGWDTEAEPKPEDKGRSLPEAAPWKRFWIFAGGPLFNFIFTALIFMVILAIGEPQTASVVGRVLPNSPAAAAGLQAGDKVLAVGGQSVHRMDELFGALSEHPGERIELTIERAPGVTQKVSAELSAEDGYTIYGEPKKMGRLEGLIPFGRGARVGISDPNSPAAKAGFKSGDEITSVNGSKVETWEAVELESAKAESAVLDFEVRRTAEQPALRFQVPNKGFATVGLHSSELFVEAVVPDSPAMKAGLQKGDRIVAISSQPIPSFFSLRDAIQQVAEKSKVVEVTWEREGQKFSHSIEPTQTKEKDPLLNTVVTYTIGIVPGLVRVEPGVVIERVLNPFKLVAMGTGRMLDFVYKNFVSIGKMITGQVSAKSLGGPILIGKLAGESLDRGWAALLNTMAVLSVGLGILNILPIPVLDGGHILMLGLEAIRRKPLTIRQMEVMQQVGLTFILALMVFVFKNDIMRLPIFN
jgi:regulator of sigma E protease